MNFGFVLTGIVFVLIGLELARRPAYHSQRFAQYSLLRATGGGAQSRRRTRVLGILLSCVGAVILLGGITI